MVNGDRISHSFSTGFIIIEVVLYAIWMPININKKLYFLFATEQNID